MSFYWVLGYFQRFKQTQMGVSEHGVYPIFLVCWIINKLPFIIIYHQSPMGLAIKKQHKKKTPSFTRICWSCYPSKPSIASASLASSLATPVKLRSVASRKSLLLGKCLLYNYHMIVVVYVYIYIYTIKLYCIIDNVGNVGNVGNDGNVGNVTTVGNVGVCVCVNRLESIDQLANKNTVMLPSQ